MLGTDGSGVEYSYRVIGYGCKSGALNAGELNAAPQGLGFLMTSGYLSDAKVLHCASAKGMPSDYTRGTGDAYQPRGAYGLEHWRSAGGFSGGTLQYGDWTAMVKNGKDVSIQSHYNYRNVPLDILRPWHVYQDNTSATKLAGTTPAVNARIGQPMFRTVRELGARAIVCDTFSKGSHHDANKQATTFGAAAPWPGYGLRAHRDAYNVLYGDGAARIFGDPQLRIAWHMSGPYTTQNWSGLGYNMSANTYYGSVSSLCSFGADRTVGHDRFTNTALGVWHELDTHGGVDVMAP